jgi:hypothetical protein
MSAKSLTHRQLRRIIEQFDTGTGFDNALYNFAQIGRHRRTVQRWLAGEYEIDPPMAAFIRSLPKNPRPLKREPRE